MADRKNKSIPNTADRENPEWTEEDFERARPAADVVPHIVARYRGKQKAPTKKQVTVRLDADVIDHLKEGGRGWQTRLNDALRSAVFSKTSHHNNAKATVGSALGGVRKPGAKAARSRKKIA